MADMMPVAGPDPMAQISAMLSAAGVRPTTENLNRAMLAIAQQRQPGADTFLQGGENEQTEAGSTDNEQVEGSGGMPQAAMQRGGADPAASRPGGPQQQAVAVAPTPMLPPGGDMTMGGMGMEAGVSAPTGAPVVPSAEQMAAADPIALMQASEFLKQLAMRKASSAGMPPGPSSAMMPMSAGPPNGSSQQMMPQQLMPQAASAPMANPARNPIQQRMQQMRQQPPMR